MNGLSVCGRNVLPGESEKRTCQTAPHFFLTHTVRMCACEKEEKGLSPGQRKIALAAQSPGKIRQCRNFRTVRANEKVPHRAGRQEGEQRHRRRGHSQAVGHESGACGDCGRASRVVVHPYGTVCQRIIAACLRTGSISELSQW